MANVCVVLLNISCIFVLKCIFVLDAQVEVACKVIKSPKCGTRCAHGQDFSISDSTVCSFLMCCIIYLYKFIFTFTEKIEYI